MAEINFSRLSGFILLSILLLTSGCGWFVAQYDPTTMPYAGTQTDLHVIKDVWSDAIQGKRSKINHNDTDTQCPLMLRICAATLGTACFCLDMPCTFVADTLTLPVQAYLYLTDDSVDHDLKYLRQKKEREEAEQSRSDEKMNVKPLETTPKHQ